MSENVIVRTSNGPVRGRRRQGTKSNIFYSFQGIPYAKPPIGELRFKAPQKHEPWTQVRDATNPGPIAHQLNVKFAIEVPPSPHPESEDCLYVNVYTKYSPNTGNDRKLPVLVMIHGGGFNFGSSGEEMQCPDFLLEHDILYISVNYRLGVFGFLSIDDRDYDIPGNAGLKDQSMALRWVSENCAHFGGDRNNITVMGESAGGASVHYHLISDHSKDLFHRAIVQSGSALSPWASQHSGRDRNERLARALGWNGAGGPAKMLRTIIEAPAQLLAQKQCEISTAAEKQTGQLFLFVPIVEPYNMGNAFVDVDVPSMNRTAWGHSIPLLVGGTTGEGYLLYGQLVQSNTVFDNSYFDNVLPRELSLDDANRRRLGAALRKFYYDNETPSVTNIAAYMDLLTDKLFWHGVYGIVCARLANPRSAPTYLYHFDYTSDRLNMMQMILCGEPVKSMVHAEDLLYQFRFPALHDALPDDCDEVRLRQIYNSLCTSFAATGKPTHPDVEPLNWEPVHGAAPFKCLNISEQLSVIDLPHTKRLQYWNALYDFVN